MTISSAVQYEQGTQAEPTLFVAFELSLNTWQLAFTTGLAQRPRQRGVPARNVERVLDEIAKAKKRFGLPAEAQVVSCYEAGRDGFWLHRFLLAHHISNHVVDSSSIEVQRRRRRAKTDRLDVHKLLRLLLRHYAGEKKVWSVVHVPSVEEEDQRQLHRELLSMKRDRTRVINRIKGLLASQGLTLVLKGDVPQQLAQLRLWDGSCLPVGLRDRLVREWEQVQSLSERIVQLEAARRERLRTSEDKMSRQIQQLVMLKGIGTHSAWVFVMEFFGWRSFRNGKEVGALAGLTPTPHASGDSSYELGIAKAGNPRIRAMAVEIAWGWLRFQPESALAKWYQSRFGSGSGRLRRIGIVALARKLLIALWRYLETGALPEGAVLKQRVRL